MYQQPYVQLVCKLQSSTVTVRLNVFIQWRQETIIRSVQLSYSLCETAFSQVGLFLDKPFPRIGFQ